MILPCKRPAGAEAPRLGSFEASRPGGGTSMGLDDRPKQDLAARCGFDGGARYRLRSRGIACRLRQTAWHLRGVEAPAVRKGRDRYLIGEADRPRCMLPRPPQ